MLRKFSEDPSGIMLLKVFVSLKIYRYVDSLEDHLIRYCRVASLVNDIDISHIKAFAQNTEDLSQRIRDIIRDRDLSKRAHTIGSYRCPCGYVRLSFH